MQDSRTGIGRKLLAIGALLIFAATGFAQPETAPDYSLYRPILEISQRLERQYAKPVTVEGPVNMWRGNMVSTGHIADGTEILGIMPYTFVLPAGDPLLQVSTIGIGLVRRFLDVYHRQNPGRTRYEVLESTMGFHIVPIAAHDEAGVMRPVTSLLDTPIEVLSSPRTATEHFDAVLQAVAQSTGIAFRTIIDIDGFYAANGYLPPVGNILGEPLEPDERQYKVFKWGASEVKARDALIDLAEGSATTLTWELSCGPDFQRGNKPICNLTLGPLSVGDKRTVLYLDRCTKCKPMPVRK